MPIDMHQAKPEWHMLLFFWIGVIEGYTAASAQKFAVQNPSSREPDVRR